MCVWFGAAWKLTAGAVEAVREEDESKRGQTSSGSKGVDPIQRCQGKHQPAYLNTTAALASAEVEVQLSNVAVASSQSQVPRKPEGLQSMMAAVTGRVCMQATAKRLRLSSSSATGRDMV